jgi:hypothetical protein
MALAVLGLLFHNALLRNQKFRVVLTDKSGYAEFMKLGSTKLILPGLIPLLLAGVILGQSAGTDGNPYTGIVERNPFGLKPPPSPPSPEENKPPVQMAKVTLTGLITMFGEPRALFEITEQEAGKPAPPIKPILREGERSGSIELVSIDINKNTVKIRNAGFETNLTFEIQKTASAGPAAPPAVPGAVYRPPQQPFGIPQPNLPGTTYSRFGTNAAGSSGVTVLGGGAAPSAPTPGLPGATVTPGTPANYSGTMVLGAPSTTPPGPAGTPSAVPTPLSPPTATGLRTIPSRPIRAEPPVPQLPPRLQNPSAR